MEKELELPFCSIVIISMLAGALLNSLNDHGTDNTKLCIILVKYGVEILLKRRKDLAKAPQ
jgi:hypothetical protein